MSNTLFVVGLTVVMSAVLVAAFKVLPKERWQILASVPIAKNNAGHWEGINLTWYGLLNANAYAGSVGLLFVLLGAVNVAQKTAFVMIALVLMFCIPASRLIARIVEKKPYTFTVGGASFVGMIIAPWIIGLLNHILIDPKGSPIPTLPVLSALAIAYAFGEGLGRLACISFGCCYGKRLSACPAFLSRFFQRFSFVFTGSIKKISYAGGMEGEPVLPIQALTSVLYLAAALVGMLLYLNGFFLSSFVLSVLVTQGWRAISEMLRDDYRGSGKISAYQIMSLGGAVYSLGFALLFTLAQGGSSPTPGVPVSVDIMAGLKAIWNPGMLLSLQLFWGLMFFYTGRSMVTGSSLFFYVHKGRV